MSAPAINVKRKPEHPGALFVAFDNPDAMNAYTPDMMRKLVSVLCEARLDDSVKLVVLSGVGERALSAGLSMDELNKMKTYDDFAVFYTLGLEIREAIAALDKPMLSAVMGNCVGGGFEISLCCDLIYAAEGSRFLLPEIKIGLTPGGGGAINLPKKIPANRAFEMLLFSERVTAEELKTWGVVNKVFPVATFWEEVGKCIDRILAMPPVAVRGLRELMNSAVVSSDDPLLLKTERRLAVDTMCTEDFHEAVKAFQEKRPPVFKGK
ncbi:MAG: enoyl-CoA hydratase/isomerase family protein [Oscillospiraceae bacterium]|jgi:enoyl-CoA hydratase/carnithine racemase|nr:enoyl-CoA hydratase/isomerase family protein [Oscillospiraceae bacterium]